MEKIYLLDTSVAVHDPDVLSKLANSEIIIPIAVLEELDKLKSQYSITGANARRFLKILDNLNITGPVDLLSGSKLTIDTFGYDGIGVDKSYGDNRILACAMARNGASPLTVLSRDYNLRIRARVFGISAEDYSNDKYAASKDDLYTGTKVMENFPVDLIDQFYIDGMLKVDEDFVKENDIFPNMFLVLKNEDGGKSATCRFYDDMTLRPLKGPTKAFGMTTRNKEQSFALDLLFDDSVKLVTLSGMAGTGKTLLSVASGLQQVLEEKRYEKLFIIKSTETVGKDIGALPGTKLEKMAPFIQSVMDNVAVLFNNNNKKKGTGKKSSGGNSAGGGGGGRGEEVIQDPYLSLLLEKGTLEVESLAFLRGRSISNAFIILDELQNITPTETRTLISRLGNNSKICCTADHFQVDHKELNMFYNGATYVADKFKHYPIAGHVTLVKGERSELADLAARIL